MRRELAGAVLVWLGGFAVVLAQESTTGSIAGKATDAQGGGLPGADVTLSSGQGERTVVTDGRGRFLVPYLRVVPDERSASGYRTEIGPFPGWAEVPEW